MSDLKFSCPSCGQHVQCDEAHAGENIPCPACAQLIRVPVSATVVPVETPKAVTENPFAHDESKVSYTPAEAAKETPAEKAPTLEENLAGASSSESGSRPPLTEREQKIAAARATRPIEVTPTVKPRLSFVLTGGQAPAPQENDSALTPEQKERVKRSSEIKTVNE